MEPCAIVKKGHQRSIPHLQEFNVLQLQTAKEETDNWIMW